MASCRGCGTWSFFTADGALCATCGANADRVGWASLRGNTAQSLNTRDVRVRLHAPPVSETWMSQHVRVPREDRLKDKRDPFDRTGTSSFRMTEYTSWKNIKRTNFELDHLQNTLNVKFATPGSVTTYYLPWTSGEGCHMKLGGNADLFLTAPLNGCGLVIGGSRREPIFVHANLDSYDLDEGVVTNLATPAANGRATKENQLAVYAKFYGNLALALSEARIVVGDDVRVFTPAFYLEDAAAMVVFGVRRDAEWTFYYNLGVMSEGPRGITTRYVTGELWPTFTDYK